MHLPHGVAGQCGRSRFGWVFYVSWAFGVGLKYDPGVSSAVTSFSTVLPACEDNEAAIKVVLKRRSPALRHVSITHRVCLDSMFDVIAEQNVSMKYVSTKNQVADFMTKGFSKTETWDHLVRIAGLVA